MNTKLKELNLVYRKLKLSDYQKFKKLFYSCFKKKITYNFFKWRYFDDKHSFCYGVFESSKLIANVGMKAMKLNYKKNKIIYSRHSSMVLGNYRGIGIFSELLKKVKKKILNKFPIVVMWPNKNNFSNFGIKKSKILKKKYHLYKIQNFKKKRKITSNYNLNQLNKLKFFFKNTESFFYKDLNYFKKRYLYYKKNEYLINVFELKNLKSFFILKKNIDKKGLNYVILEHFGSKQISKEHFKNLVNENKETIFWTSNKIYKPNYILIDSINLNIGLIKNFSFKEKKLILSKKNFMIGDTDSFITIK